MRHILVILVTAILPAGCGSSDQGFCDPGSTQPCVCASGTEGAQVCDSDGERWGECTCLEPDTSTDADFDPPSDTFPEVTSECDSDADCDDDDPCTRDMCDADGDCAHDPVDADGDGFPAMEAGGVACGGTDCDDARANVYPGAQVLCEEDDRNCSGHDDRDEDGDGYLSADVCPETGDDCRDFDPDVNPGETAECEAIDADCDTVIDCTAEECPDECPCTVQELTCNDGFDDDCDGRVDCDDEDCSRTACCLESSCPTTMECCSFGCCNALADPDCCGGCSTSCNEGEVCCGGACVVCCEDEHCDDADPCTTDTCTDDACSHSPAPDSSDCGSGGVCCDGACIQCCVDEDCDDANPCTTDSCTDGVCSHVITDDMTTCGAGSICCSGTCAPGDCCANTDCDDDNPCTYDLCTARTCSSLVVMDRTVCGEGRICCGGTCLEGNCCSDLDCGGLCKGTARPCSDFTDGTGCEAQGGCIWDETDRCLGPSTKVSCNAFDQESDCDSCIPGCWWNESGGWGSGACTGTPASPMDCESVTLNWDCMDCGCTWVTGTCYGWQWPCSAYFDPADCESHDHCYVSTCVDHACS
jgi:hypothetical protein